MELAAAHVDVVRLGWGSAMVTQALEAKLATYLEHDVAPMLGGTLTELAWRHGRIDQLREALLRLGIAHVEVSEGTLDLPIDDKRRLIQTLDEDFTVFVEVGSKDGRLAPGVRAVGAPGVRGAGRRRARDRLRGPRVRRRRAVLAGRLDPRRAGRGARRRGRASSG